MQLSHSCRGQLGDNDDDFCFLLSSNSVAALLAVIRGSGNRWYTTTWKKDVKTPKVDTQINFSVRINLFCGLWERGGGGGVLFCFGCYSGNKIVRCSRYKRIRLLCVRVMPRAVKICILGKDLAWWSDARSHAEIQVFFVFNCEQMTDLSIWWGSRAAQ
jgi:hypothetical protein